MIVDLHARADQGAGSPRVPLPPPHVHVGVPVRATVTQDRPAPIVGRPVGDRPTPPGPTITLRHRPALVLIIAGATLVLFGWAGALAGYLLELPTAALVRVAAVGVILAAGWLLFLMRSRRIRSRLVLVLVGLAAGGAVVAVAWLSSVWSGQ